MSAATIVALIIGGVGISFGVMHLISKWRNRPSPSEVANVLERFIQGTSPGWEWDDFTSVPLHDPALDKIRIRCRKLDEEFPPKTPGHYCSEGGIEVLKAYVKELREMVKQADA